MPGAQLIPSSFNYPAGGARQGFPGVPGFLKGFSNNGNHLGQLKQAEQGSGADAGKVMMARLMSSVESRFAMSRVEIAGPVAEAPSAPAADDFSPDAVTQRIIGFVQQRLEKEKANGASEERLQSLMDQAREGIEKGFAQAKDIIVDQGIFTDEVKDNYLATVSRVQQGLEELEDTLFGAGAESAATPPVPASPEAAAGQPAAGQTRVASESLYYNQTRSFDMQVKTRDGDLVTIRVNGEESFSSSSFAAASDGVSVAGIDARYSNSANFSFSVEGELDKGELAALNDLFSQVNDIADTFYGGDVEAAFSQAMDVGYDASELAGFAVNMRRTEVVAVRQAYAEVSRYGRPGNGGADSAPQNPLQSVMDKLTDFAGRVQEARNSLLAGPALAEGNGSLFADLIKSLVPARENAAGSNQQAAATGVQQSGSGAGPAGSSGISPDKAAFDRFIDSLVA